MNRIKRHQASRIEAYIAAIQYKLDQLLKAVQDGKKKHMHLTIENWLYLRDAELQHKLLSESNAELRNEKMLGHCTLLEQPGRTLCRPALSASNLGLADALVTAAYHLTRVSDDSSSESNSRDPLRGLLTLVAPLVRRKRHSRLGTAVGVEVDRERLPTDVRYRTAPGPGSSALAAVDSGASI